MNHPHYKDAGQVFKKVDSKKVAGASGATSEANKAAIRLTAWQTSHEESCRHRRSLPKGVRSDWLHDAAEGQKPIHCSTCGQAFSVLPPTLGPLLRSHLHFPCDCEL